MQVKRTATHISYVDIVAVAPLPFICGNSWCVRFFVLSRFTSVFALLIANCALFDSHCSCESRFSLRASD